MGCDLCGPVFLCLCLLFVERAGVRSRLRKSRSRSFTGDLLPFLGCSSLRNEVRGFVRPLDRLGQSILASILARPAFLITPDGSFHPRRLVVTDHLAHLDQLVTSIPAARCPAAVASGKPVVIPAILTHGGSAVAREDGELAAAGSAGLGHD